MTLCDRVVAGILICAVVFSASGCTTFKAVTPETDPSKPAYSKLGPGDTVMLDLRDGKRLEIIVGRVESDAIVSVEGTRYAREDIAGLERRSISAARTTALVAAIVLGGVWLVTGILITLGCC